MNNKLEMAQHKFIGSIGKLCDSFGLNRFVAQLYAVLYLSNKPLSLDDIVEKMGVSKGNVSVNIRELEKWGAVRSVWIKGSRKDYYEAEPNIKKVFLNKAKTSMHRRIAEVSSMLAEFNDIIKSAESEASEEDKVLIEGYKKRLKDIEDLKAMALTAVNFAEKIL